MTDEQARLEFIEKKVPLLILENNKDFKNHKIITSKATAKRQLDGFMCTIVALDLTLEDQNGV